MWRAGRCGVSPSRYSVQSPMRILSRDTVPRTRGLYRFCSGSPGRRAREAGRRAAVELARGRAVELARGRAVEHAHGALGRPLCATPEVDICEEAELWGARGWGAAGRAVVNGAFVGLVGVCW